MTEKPFISIRVPEGMESFAAKVAVIEALSLANCAAHFIARNPNLDEAYTDMRDSVELVEGVKEATAK